VYHAILQTHTNSTVH